MKTMNEIEEELSMKAQRVGYWEAFRRLPGTEEIKLRGKW